MYGVKYNVQPMDFLDPKAKRRHLITLIIGYGLMAILIAIATFILVYSAYGFDVDRKTGQVIQNGLVFVDSAPDKAKVQFNGSEQKDQTNSRYALPSGQYDLKIEKNQYRPWQRSFELKGGAVERFTYPMLIVSDLKPQQFQTYDVSPRAVTESPDRRWLIVASGSSLVDFTEYDLNTLNNNDQPQTRQFKVAADLFTQAAGAHVFEVVEWANDNKHFLIKHTYQGGNEFVMVARENQAESININRLLSQSPTKVTLRDKKFDQWHLYNEAGGVLQLADAKKVITPLLTNVTSYKTHDDDTILYSQLTADGKYQRISLIQDGKEPYAVKDVAAGAVFLDIARYDGSWYVVIGSDAEHRTYVYREPLNVLQRKDGTKPAPRTIQKAIGAMTQVSFSKNTRFIMTQSGQHIEVHDAEYNRNYAYDAASPFDPAIKLEWMDGHRLQARSQNRAIMFDYDGLNKQELVTNLTSSALIFDRDYTAVYSIDTVASNKSGLFTTKLRLDEDM